MTAILANAINNAARDLPAGWLIELCVERGAGWVELYNPDGDRHELEELADSSLGEQVTAAINEALRASGAAPAQETRAGHETSAAPSGKFCIWCNGVGRIGMPGTLCLQCKGTGRETK